MHLYLNVFLGTGIGGALRHGVNVWSARAFGLSFPHGTFIVNIVGSLTMGLIAGYFMVKGNASQTWRLFLATGILSGFTTFSSFSLDIALLTNVASRRRWRSMSWHPSWCRSPPCSAAFE